MGGVGVFKQKQEFDPSTTRQSILSSFLESFDKSGRVATFVLKLGLNLGEESFILLELELENPFLC